MVDRWLLTAVYNKRVLKMFVVVGFVFSNRLLHCYDATVATLRSGEEWMKSNKFMKGEMSVVKAINKHFKNPFADALATKQVSDTTGVE